jgi:hypothetical protein
MLNAILLNVVMLSVFILNVVAPLQTIDTLGSELLNFMFNWCHDITPKDNQQTNNSPLQLPSSTVNVCRQADTVFDDKGYGGSGLMPRSSFWLVLN